MRRGSVEEFSHHNWSLRKTSATTTPSSPVDLLCGSQKTYNSLAVLICHRLHEVPRSHAYLLCPLQRTPRSHADVLCHRLLKMPRSHACFLCLSPSGLDHHLHSSQLVSVSCCLLSRPVTSSSPSFSSSFAPHDTHPDQNGSFTLVRRHAIHAWRHHREGLCGIVSVQAWGNTDRRDLGPEPRSGPTDIQATPGQTKTRMFLWRIRRRETGPREAPGRARQDLGRGRLECQAMDHLRD